MDLTILDKSLSQKEEELIKSLLDRQNNKLKTDLEQQI